MPEIATQTDPCVDVIDRLNEEFNILQNEMDQLKNENKRLLILKKGSGYGFCVKCDEIHTGIDLQGEWCENMELCNDCEEKKYYKEWKGYKSEEE